MLGKCCSQLKFVSRKIRHRHGAGGVIGLRQSLARPLRIKSCAKWREFAGEQVFRLLGV